MKNRFFAAILLIAMVVAVSSCATSRKYGCPMVGLKTQKANS
ncbi:MAG TPA: hypothetical protein VF476_10220 [Chitinophagaceae bacterium]